jgi:hypothetical protein
VSPDAVPRRQCEAVLVDVIAEPSIAKQASLERRAAVGGKGVELPSGSVAVSGAPDVTRM